MIYAGLLVATITILIRSSFRVAELTGGFHGKLWHSEIDFMVLDGAMIAIASLLMTLFHPGLAFHGRWSVVKRG
jgi:RTA1 like protein